VHSRQLRCVIIRLGWCRRSEHSEEVHMIRRCRRLEHSGEVK
jgi:hypothetical protein